MAVLIQVHRAGHWHRRGYCYWNKKPGITSTLRSSNQEFPDSCPGPLLPLNESFPARTSQSLIYLIGFGGSFVWGMFCFVVKSLLGESSLGRKINSSTLSICLVLSSPLSSFWYESDPSRGASVSECMRRVQSRLQEARMCTAAPGLMEHLVVLYTQNCLRKVTGGAILAPSYTCESGQEKMVPCPGRRLTSLQHLRTEFFCLCRFSSLCF